MTRRSFLPACLAAGALLPASAAVARDEPLIVVPSAEQKTLLGDDPARGDVPVVLDIAPNGDLRCSASIGSQPASLKRASCGLIAKRGVFYPDFGKDGKAVQTQMRVVVRWRLDGKLGEFGGAIPISPARWITNVDYPLRELLDGTTTVRFEVTETGRVRDCHVVKTSRSLVLDGAVCPLLLRRAAFLPALAPDGSPMVANAEFSHHWPFDDFAAPPARLPDKGRQD